MRFTISDKVGHTKSFSIEKDVIVIGRGSKADAFFDHPEMSRNHAKLYEIDGRYFIEDLGGTNGVSINRQKLQPYFKAEIKNYMVVNLGPNIELKLLEQDLGLQIPTGPQRQSVANPDQDAEKTLRGMRLGGQAPLKWYESGAFKLSVLALAIACLAYRFFLS